MKRSKAAFLLNVRQLGDSLYFWTFTFREKIDVTEARKQWHLLCTHLRKKLPSLVGLRVFEMHERHGLHVHVVTTRYVRVEKVRECIAAMRTGKFGRIHVERARSGIGPYLGKYLSKPRPECLKGWRLWAALDKEQYAHTRVADVILESLYASVWQKAKECFGWKGNKGFKERKMTVFRLLQLCVVYDCEPGQYPGGIWNLQDPDFHLWYREGLQHLRNTLLASGPF